MEYRILRKSHWYALFNSLGLFTIIFIVISAVLIWKNGIEFLEGGMLKYALVFYLVMVIPALLIYLEYYIQDRDVRILVDKIDEFIIYRKGGVEKKIRFQDVKQFDVFGETENITFFPASSFSFARLIVCTGEEIYFTNLLKYKLHEIFPEINTNRRRWIFPSIIFFKAVRTNDDIL